jgi:Rps23 Pro-64 3,4-dihydroxylase Tpa1-like proline 4-hydroxylase
MALVGASNSLRLFPHTLKDMKGTAERHKFLKAEDDLLRRLVEQSGETNWNLISSFMNGRNARQCRERYKNYLSPQLHNSPWTTAEDDFSPSFPVRI